MIRAAESLQQIAQAAYSFPDLPSALQAIAENAVQVLETGWLSVAILDPAQPGGYQAIAGHAAEQVDLQKLREFPILLDGRAVGALQVLPGQGQVLTPGEENLCHSIAGLAASAVYIAHLRQSEVFQRRQAEALRKVAQMMNYTLDRRQVLNMILEQLDQVIAYDSASIMLVSDGQITLAAHRKFQSAEQLSLQGPLEEYPHIQEVVTGRLPVIIHETHADPRWKLIPKVEYIRCWMGVPLVGRDRVIGLLNLDKEQPGFYTQQDIDLAMTFANQAALAIENAQLYQAARQAAERREILHQVSQEIVAASLEPEQIYTAIHRAAARLMPAEAFVITQYYEQKHLIEAVYMYDRSGRAPGQIIPEDRGLSGQVIHLGRSIYISDTHTFNRQSDVFHFGDPEEVRSALAVPMRLRGKVVGMLSTQCYTPEAYNVEDLYLLETLAAYAAIALDNASLFIHIQQLAITDALTGIFNRRHLFDLGEREFLRARRFNRPLAAIMIDIDHFKLANDTCGHDAGDEVLRRLCQLIKRNVRDVDIVGRYGGEEFTIILPEADLQAAGEIAERLRRVVEQTFSQPSGCLPRITISLGVTTMRADTPNLENLIHLADIALYAAKNAGRNRVNTYQGK